MKNDIFSTYGDYLSGKKLDVGKRFYDLSDPTIVDRTEYLRQRCSRRKVLHIGCLDHPTIIAQRIEEGTWLHSVISSASELCLGIDINSRGHALVQKQFNVQNIQLLDLSKCLKDEDLNRLRKIQWDLILCPEMLEHITNHSQFLQNLGSLSCGSSTTLIITVPNAFQFGNFVNALRGFESINSDHKYWFTFYTLSALLAANGWEPRQLIYYNDSTEKHWMHALSRFAVRISKVFSNGFIIEATCSR